MGLNPAQKEQKATTESQKPRERTQATNLARGNWGSEPRQLKLKGKAAAPPSNRQFNPQNKNALRMPPTAKQPATNKGPAIFTTKFHNLKIPKNQCRWLKCRGSTSFVVEPPHSLGLHFGARSIRVSWGVRRVCDPPGSPGPQAKGSSSPSCGPAILQLCA